VIFEDPSRRRWRSAVVMLAVLLLCALTTLTLAVAGVLLPVELPDVFEKRPSVRAKALARWKDSYVKPVYSPKQMKEIASKRSVERKRRAHLVAEAATNVLPLPENALVAFTVRDDPAAHASLERHIGSIDVVIPDWFSVSGPGCELEEHIDAPTQRIVAAHDVMVLPRVANLYQGNWRGEQFAQTMRSDEARTCLVQKLVTRLSQLDADGVNVDIEELAPEDSEPLLELLVDLKNALHKKGMRLTVDVSFYDPAYDLEFIGQLADASFVMAYDQHYPASKPGPISGSDWFKKSIDQAIERVGAERLVVALGAYCYDWIIADGAPPAEGLSFREAMDRARAAGATPEFEREAENARFAYTDGEQRVHDVWCQDALSAWNQRLMMRGKGLNRVAVWRLGTEDETVWSVLDQKTQPDPAQVLSTIPKSPSVDLFGDGEVLTIRSEPTAGTREMELDESGRVISARYTQIPTGFVVERRGSSGKDIVLTFDDGPDPRWTPRVLDVLSDLKVPAVFFVIGDQVMQYPDLVAEADADGHLIANHTFNHPHLDKLTPAETRLELNSTARLLEGLTGKRSPVFRAPYTANVDPSRPEDLTPLRLALQNGYLFVGANIDPLDWQQPGAREIARRMVEQAERGGRIVLLHDGGGEREQTIGALRIAVPELKKRGYRFVTLDQYMGVSRADLIEPLDVTQQAFAWGNLSVARARSWGWIVLSVLFFGCTILAIGRVIMLGVLTLVQARRETPPRPEGFEPLVTVLVPAYNEGKVIERTVKSVLTTGYENVEVLVIDDGSTDDTAQVVRRLMAREPRVRLLSKQNGGKAHAANAGLLEARGSIVVAVDADTIILRDAIEHLVGHFANPEVTAVCGNVEVGNVHDWLTRFQAIEYVTSQNFDRRAFAVLNSVSVVPGALGAWRREAVLKVGGYSSDTLTEDADLTLTVLRAGGRIEYEPRAIGRTEAPETVSGLLKQRFRWTYGTYQCLFKHRAAFFRGTLGWFGLPNMVVFQVLFAALSPIGDLVMVLSLFRGDFGAFAAGYIAFLLMDVCGSLLAFTLDGKPLRWLWMLLVQRFTYRQMMYYVSLKAMLAALQGARHGWRKLDRTGSVDFASIAPRAARERSPRPADNHPSHTDLRP
jgi:cellulose synthase/poly-beta-1,6-N-acetylglucosamine synthase-like glycosyltransferase/peptidoglycan/xylan/chitin deacetylase (PgdA/CDA1 family)/spore germination protein YaaH